MENAESWAADEFGGAKLGNELRTRRLVGLAAAAARAPDGRVTRVCRTSATREGAFRWVENPRVDAGAVARSEL